MTNINWEKYKKVIKKEFSEKEETEEVKNYIFSSQLDKVNLILEHMDTVGGIHSRNIAITGDRGTGKTSFIETLKLVLEKQNYYVFDIVSPTVLSSHLNILEIVISSIYREIDQFIDSHDVHDRGRLIQHLKKVMNAIAVEKKQSDYFKQSKPEIEMLTDLSHRTFLDEEIKELFCYFQKVLNNRQDSCKEGIKDFVLIVDDLDLVENSLVYDLLRDIQHYLDSQLIIIFAYKEGQLELSMFEHLAKGSETLLKYEVIDSNAIFGQIERFLTKLVPLSNRIPLFKQDELLNKTIGEFLASLDPSYGVGENFEFITNDTTDNKNHLTIREWFYESIFYRTNLKLDPIDIREEASRLMPKTLREMVQLCEELYSMKVVALEKNRKAKVQALKSNLVYLKRYIDYKNTSQFNQQQIDFLSRWELSNSYQANYLTYHFLLSSSQDVDKKVYPFDRASYEAHNLTLGDVYAVMEEIKFSNFATGEILYFIYTLKIMYSIRLSELLYKTMLLEFDHNIFKKMQTESLSYYSEKLKVSEYQETVDALVSNYPSFRSYLELINTRFMPEGFNYDGRAKRNEDFYLIQWKESEGSTNRLFKEIFIGTELSAKGNAINHVPERNSAFRYRDLYSFRPLNLTNTRHYTIDFFLFATKADLVALNIIEFCENSSTSPYFMTSMFHIDSFVRHNYNKGKENENEGGFPYILKQVVELLWDDKKRPYFNMQKWYTSLENRLASSEVVLLPLLRRLLKLQDNNEFIDALSDEYARLNSRSGLDKSNDGLSQIELDNIYYLPLASDVKKDLELQKKFSISIIELKKQVGLTINVGNLGQFRRSLKEIGQNYPTIQMLVEKLAKKRTLSLEFVEEFIRTVEKLGEADESN